MHNLLNLLQEINKQKVEDTFQALIQESLIKNLKDAGLHEKTSCMLVSKLEFIGLEHIFEKEDLARVSQELTISIMKYYQYLQSKYMYADEMIVDMYPNYLKSMVG